MKQKWKGSQTTNPTIKLKYFAKVLGSLSDNVILNVKLTDGATLMSALIKWAKYILNQK